MRYEQRKSFIRSSINMMLPGATALVDAQADPDVRDLLAYVDALETSLREAYQITHYGRGTMQDVDDVLERAIRGSAHNPEGNAK